MIEITKNEIIFPRDILEKMLDDEIDGFTKIKQEDLIILLENPEGLYRLSYLMEMIKDHQGVPNKFSVSRKLKKYKNGINTSL